MKRLRKNSLALQILRGIGLAGLVLVAATSPYFGLGIIKGFKGYRDKKAWRKFYASLDYLNRRGYVKILSRNGAKMKVRITQQGESQIYACDIDSIELSRPGDWDGKWRLVIFDIPVAKNSNRLAFTEKLKQLGFIMVQKSVWAYPFECHKEVMILRKFYNIEFSTSYLEVSLVEDEKDWRGKFNLKYPESNSAELA